MELQFAANLSILYPEKPVLERFAAAADNGFTRAELWWAYQHPAAVLREQLEAHGLSLILFNLYPGDFASGDRGLTCDPARRDEFRRALDEGLETARELRCPRINVMVGLRRDDLPREAQRACLNENLRWAAPRARDAGVTLLIEALNPRDMPGWYLTSSLEAYAILEDVNEPNVKFEYDFYHIQILEGNLTRNFLDHLGQIGHVQVADVPGRHQPGTGEINYPFVLRTIEDSTYDGCIGLEYVPLGMTEESFAWLPRGRG